MNVIHRLRLCVLLVFITFSLFAQTGQDPRIGKFLSVRQGMKTNAAHDYLRTLFPEWDLKKMQHICLIVGDWTPPEEVGTRFKYMYQQRFYLAAKVDTLHDNEQNIATKISAMWKIYQQTGYTSCNAITFDIRDGNLLKYAVAVNFDQFLEDAIKWQLDLNKIDLYDQMTLLDYIDFHLARSKGSAMQSKYQKYHDMFRKAGAKYKKELQ
ncbi:hypothetical protein SRABI27_02161 [Pedobacter sp. Bi27]|uniref:hypothetical protein n=1 Tax=unclassified Pedobacter TaxID=2628915 RepID=UPI001D2D8A36|nr:MULTISPECIES: hypothetical protein [unclassified Pedobacter]CAH0218203.1 hypothetical protein SRABI27_02161 [Pedobacter sp. Bi27]CAH0231533.1 hypothetical protein SRABI36_02733 [Pedobacter sp. Bi36]CAH0258323.1 hypothetical protein SRABI126_03133 [Pedobacter sp. Bi126]